MLRYLIAIMLFSINVYGGTIDPNVDKSKYIEYGKKHECVLPIVGISIDEEGANSFFNGSCVLINSQYFLTAAHVVQDSVTQHLLHNKKAIECTKLIIHKDFKNKYGYFDIAIGRLRKPIEIEFYPELYTKNDEVNKICSISGFGFSGNFNTGYDVSVQPKHRLAGSNYIDSIEKHLLICSADKGIKTSLEFLIAPGDSGGGLFINQKLAGINSCVFATDGKPDSDKSDYTGHTRVSIFIEWINTQMSKIESDLQDVEKK